MLYKIIKNPSIRIKLFSVLVLTILLGLLYAIRNGPVLEGETARIYSYELREMSSVEFIETLKRHRIVYVLEDKWGSRYIENWPDISEIASLLDMISSEEKCGVLGNIYSSYWPTRKEVVKPCSIIASHLLKAVKEGRFNYYPPKNKLSASEISNLKKWAEGEIQRQTL